MQSHADAAEKLILEIHEAPLDETRWVRVIEALRGLVHADRAMLFSVPLGKCEGFWHVLSGVEEDFTTDYANEFSPEDPWASAARHLPAPMTGRIVTGEELIDRRSFLRTRFFHDYARRYDVDRFLCALLRDPLYLGAPPSAALRFYRQVGATEFTAACAQTLSRFVPHLARAVDTFWRLRGLTMNVAVMGETIDAIAAAVFIVDRRGRVLYENSAAESLLRSGDCLRLVGGHLEPAPAVIEQKRCREALQGLRAGRSATIRLTLGARDRTVILSMAPFSEASAVRAPCEAAAGFLWLLPAGVIPDAANRVATLFGLTAAETRLVELLAAGSSLSQAAGLLQVSIHTARNQLKAVQRKTGWRTQGQLIRMVNQLAMVAPVAERVARHSMRRRTRTKSG